jgi:thiosulfate/3-mercaptopyruvate sulfurtransferase
VRTPQEYSGERFWPSGGMEPGGQAGHIPGAVHQPIDGMYDDRGAFLDPASLRKVFPAAGPDRDGEVITYCTIGGRASTAWFVLTHLLGRDMSASTTDPGPNGARCPAPRSKRPEPLTRSATNQKRRT